MVLLSNEVWRDSFGEDPDVIGETLELDSTSFTVIGVMPQDFRFPRAGMVDVWVPLEQHGTVAGRRVNYGELIARLVDGLSVEQAQERLGGLAAGLNEARPHERVWNVRLVPHDPIRANTDTQRALWVLMTAVVFMLLIAAVNSINLMLARTTVRAREIAVRLALGASRSQVARLLVTEAVLLALTGAALAVAVAKMAIPLILRLMPGELTFFAVTDIVVDARVLVYTFVIAFVVGVTCGAVPALKLVRPSPALPSWAEIYSVLSFAVRQRTRELGIRSALGAGPDALRRMVMGDGLLLAGAGTILGLACALGLTRFLRTLLFGVEPTDPLTFVAVSVLMTAIGAIACWFPARKATQVDPQTALRVE